MIFVVIEIFNVLNGNVGKLRRYFRSFLKIFVLNGLKRKRLTLPLSTLRAADNSDCGITPFSAPKVFTTDDTDDGIDNPCEFSARTRNMYDVAGLSSPICNGERGQEQRMSTIGSENVSHWKSKAVAVVVVVPFSL